MKFCEVSKGFAVFSVQFYREELREGVSRLVNLHHELVIELTMECTLKTTECSSTLLVTASVFKDKLGQFSVTITVAL